MATSATPRIPELSASSDIDVYLERLEHYFICAKVAEDAKVSALVTLIGEAAYKTLRSLCQPDKVASKTYAELAKLLREHLAPSRSTLAARFNFQGRIQLSEESFATFVAELKAASADCMFGANLDERLRDQIVFGLRSNSARAKILEAKNSETDTSAKVIAIVQAVDLAERSSAVISRQSTVSDVAQVSAKHHSSIDTDARSSGRRTAGRIDRHRSQLDGPRQPHACESCGGDHRRQLCKFRAVKCHACGKLGHIRRACRSASLHQVTEDADDNSMDEDIHMPVFSVNPSARDTRVSVNLHLEGQACQFELDTGAAVTLMPSVLQQQLLPQLKLSPTDTVLRSFAGEKIRPLGQANVQVEHNGQRLQLPLLIVLVGESALLGRDWLRQMRLDWHQIGTQINQATATSVAAELTAEFPLVFADGLGLYRHGEVQLHASDKVKAKFFRARQVPYALRERVDDELQRMESDGVITPVKHSEWAAPIVPVVKADGSVRICGDYKMTFNAVATPEHYPLPRIEDIFAKLGGGHKWSKFDLSKAFLQFPLSATSKKLLTINTPKGLYEVNRLPFGINCASAIFQRTLESLLGDLDDVQVFVDDILVTGKSKGAHTRNLRQVLQRLQEAGLRLNRNKCQFFQDSVEYLGHRIDETGLRPLDNKVAAVRKAPAPTDVSQLRSFLGMLTHYGRFMPDLATIVAPLNQLLTKSSPWTWGPEQQRAFETSKKLLQESPVLVHFDPSQPIRLECDASPYGLGCVLTHRIRGEDHPVAFASRTLTPTQRGYSQLDKEALAIMFGLQRFHQYLYGRRFTIVTDHKPLLGLLGEHKGIQRWAIKLAGYDYVLEFRRTEQHGNCDSLSRLPIKSFFTEEAAVNAFLLDENPGSAISAREVAQQARTDTTLGRVLRCLRTDDRIQGDGLVDFRKRQDELSVEQGCITWGTRVVIPSALRRRVLNEIHQGHPGVGRMRALARSYVWWPGLDEDLEAVAKSCQTCALNQPDPPKAAASPWPYPDGPWNRLHLDFAGPIDGRTYLVVMDAYSKWPEVFPMQLVNSASTIARLKEAFARFGLPRTLVTDNGSQFSSAEFENFTRANGISHVFSAPFHPATNGQAERFVQCLKRHFRKSGSLQLCIAHFPLRVSQHATRHQSGTTKSTSGRQMLKNEAGPLATVSQGRSEKSSGATRAAIARQELLAAVRRSRAQQELWCWIGQPLDTGDGRSGRHEESCRRHGGWSSAQTRRSTHPITGRKSTDGGRGRQGRSPSGPGQRR
jgi:transposase InsO family protein